MSSKTITLKKIYHRDAWRIAVCFEKDFSLIAICKNIGAKFSATNRCWYLDYSKENYHLILSNFVNIEIIKESKKIINPAISEEPAWSPSPIQPLQVKSDTQATLTNIKNWDEILRFKLLKNIGKYWVFKLQYHFQITPRLKATKGVFWNKNYGCYFALRTSNVKVELEHLLGKSALFPTDFYEPNTNFGNEKVIIQAYMEDTQWMAVQVPAISELIEELKRISFYRYHKEKQLYLFPAAPSLVKLLNAHLSSKGVTVISTLPGNYLHEHYLPNRKKQLLTQTKQRLLDAIPESGRAYITQYTNHLLAKNYSASTLENYTKAFIKFLNYVNFQNPENIAHSQIMEYLASLMLNGLSASAGNNTVNALKLYYHQILGKSSFDLQIPRPKKEKKLPIFLSEEEIKRLFSVVENKKHKLLLFMAYGSGLRVGELVTLRWEDIRWNDHKIHIKGGKGKKDRMVMLPTSILTLLKSYRKEYATKSYIFEGQFASMPYSTRSVQEIMRVAREKSGLELKATPHALRHSFATHLIERGTDIRYIQQLLGHKEIKTTMVYTHVTDSAINKISSPLDGMVEDHKKFKK